MPYEKTIFRLIPKGEELVDKRIEAGSQKIVPYGMQPFHSLRDRSSFLNRALCVLLCDEIDELKARIERLERGMGPVSDVDLTCGK